MPKKCPPGVFCIENATMFTIIMGVIFMGILTYYFVFARLLNMNTHSNALSACMTQVQSLGKNINVMGNNGNSGGGGGSMAPGNSSSWFFPFFRAGYTRQPGDVYLNPYAPPLRNGNLFPSDSSDPRGVPINISTSHIRMPYTQLGFLTRSSGGETMLPLMGRQLSTNRSKWQYYAISDTNQTIKIPLSYNGRSCMGEYGCDELYTGDVVYAEGYKDAFTITLYENNSPEYIPVA